MAGLVPIGGGEQGTDARSYNMMEIAEDKRSKRNPKQLDFEAAMAEFRTMFPGLDTELIESVLRANNGAVDDTIDHLLKMTVNDEGGVETASSPPTLPPKPSSNIRRSNERLAPPEPSPALPPREGSLKRNKNRSPVLYTTPQTRYDTEWNGMVIPMLGRLPSDFLRLKPVDHPPPRPPKALTTKQRSQSMRNRIPMHLAEKPVHKKSSTLQHRGTFTGHSTTNNVLQAQKNRQGHITSGVGERLSSNVLKRQIEANQRRLQESCDTNDVDSDTDRFLEDERLALIMQNEEFLRELKRNEDFMRTLEFERDMLASRLAHEQKKNRELVQQSSSERTATNWMVPRASERDEESIPSSLHISDFTSESVKPNQREPASPDQSSVFSEPLSSSSVPDEKSDVDFKDQLKSMGATSKKKFALLAKKFFTTARKKRKGNLKIVRDGYGPSTLNLLDDNDDEDLMDLTSSAAQLDREENILFEPLPDAWTSTPSSGERSRSESNHVTAPREWL